MKGVFEGILSLRREIIRNALVHIGAVTVNVLYPPHQPSHTLTAFIQTNLRYRDRTSLFTATDGFTRSTSRTICVFVPRPTGDRRSTPRVNLPLLRARRREEAEGEEGDGECATAPPGQGHNEAKRFLRQRIVHFSFGGLIRPGTKWNKLTYVQGPHGY